MAKPLTWIALVLGAAALGACTGGNAVPELHITDIEVTNEVDTLAGALEIEVHLFDAVSHEHLGCSGQDHGLEHVDASDIPYAVDAYFVSTATGLRLTQDDLIGRSVEVQVIEDDAEPCPVAPGTSDDVVGIATTDPSAFDRGDTVAFDSVVALRIANE